METLLRAPSIRKWRLQPGPDQCKRDFLSLAELTPEEFAGLLDFAEEVKHHPEAFRKALDERYAALIFEKPSLRTRVTFEVGMGQLGGRAIYLAPGDIALGKRESVADVARNLARWVDVLVVRTFSHSILERMAREAAIPVINALSDQEHPCQAVADLLTLREHRGALSGLRLAYVGDGNNVSHALLQACALAGVHLTLATPRGFEPDAHIFEEAYAVAANTGAELMVVFDPADAVHDVDAVYTDVWTSMGQEGEADSRRKVFSGYQVNRLLMSLAKPDALFMHCLPAHRGEEVTDEVLDGRHSVVLDQAENRLCSHKALLLALLGSPAGEEIGAQDKCPADSP
jgi:ornithine carbamoyltransferase